MGSNSRRVIGISLLMFLAATLVFLIYSISTFQTKLVLPSFLWRWVWNQTLIFLIESLIPLQSTALILYYSFFSPLDRERRGQDIYEPFYRLVNSVLVTLLVFTLLFTVLAEGVRPLLYSRQSHMLDQTKLARLYYSDYQQSQRASEFERAEQYLNLYLKINPSDGAAQRLLDQAKLQAASQRSRLASGAPHPAPTTPANYRDQSASSLVRIAESYLHKADYASAHYYANLALSVAPGNREAKSISAQSLSDLSKMTPTPAEREQKYYFTLKAKGRSDLESGNPLEAYYLFQSLSNSHPKDPDVVTYLKRATDQLTSFAFFKDEIDKASTYPGIQNVLFVNKRNSRATEIVLFHKMVTLISGTYVEGVEAAEFTPAGDLVYHLIAPYGKLMGNNLSMYCVARDEAVSYLPTVLSGSFSDTRHYQLPLGLGAGSLQEIASLNSSPSSSGLPRLWSLAHSVAAYGYSTTSLQVEFLRRVMIPFGFLIFSIFAIGIGWSFRVRNKRPSGFVFILIPLIPYVVYLFETFYLFSGKLLFAFVMTVAGFWPALVSLIVVQFVLVIISLIYLAGHSTEQ